MAIARATRSRLADGSHVSVSLRESYVGRPSAYASVLIFIATLLVVSCADMSQTRTDRHRPYDANVLTIPAPPPEPSMSVDDLLALHRALVGDDHARLESRLVWHLDSARGG